MQLACEPRNQDVMTPPAPSYASFIQLNLFQIIRNHVHFSLKYIRYGKSVTKLYHSDTRYRCIIRNALVTLDTLVRAAILLQATVLSGLVVTTAAVGASKALAGAGSLSALLASLVGVDLAVSELAGADTTVRLTVLAEAVVLCKLLDIAMLRRVEGKMYQWACSQT